MSLPTPYGNASKEIAPLLKGVAPPPNRGSGEFIRYRIFVDRRVVYDGPVSPVVGFPETKVYVYALHQNRIRCFFSLESRSREVNSVVWQSIALPIRMVQKAVRYLVTIPGIKPKTSAKRATPTSVQNARRRVDTPSNGSVRSGHGFPKSSTVRPSSESVIQADTSTAEGNNGGYFLNTTSSGYIRHTRSWTGTRTPGFGKLKKQQLPVNPHTVAIQDITDGMTATLSFIPSTGIFFNRFRRFTIDYPVPPSPGHNADAQFKSLRKLIERAESNIEGNIAQDIAQIGQTTRLIANTCKRLAKSVVALKKGNIPGAIEALWSGHMPRYHGRGPSIGKSVASNWLELQYGWKPLIQDVRASMEALKRLNDGSSPLVRRVTSSATTEANFLSAIPHRVIPGLRAGTYTSCVNSRVKYVIRYKIQDKLKAFLAQTGFTNPINLGWEIIPFTFVVDWFIPIGPYLETLSSWDGLVFLDGSLSRFSRIEETSVVGAGGTLSGVNYEDHGWYTRRTILFNREKLTALPSAKMPSVLKNGLASTTHAANALALLRAAFR